MYLGYGLGGGENSIPAQDAIWTAPSSLSYSSGVRYLVILIALITFVYIILKRLYENRLITNYHLIILAFTAGKASFAGIRMISLNNNPIGYSFQPGLCAIALLYSYRNDISDRISQPTFSSFAAVGVVLLLITSLMFIPILYHNDGISDQETNFHRIESSSNWHSDYANEPVKSDIFTAHTFALHTNNDINIDRIHPDDLLVLYGLESPQQDEFYALNFGLEIMDARAWLDLRAWEHSEERVNSTKNLDKMFDDGKIKTYKTSQSR